MIAIIIAIVILVLYNFKKKGYKINLNSVSIPMLILTISFGLATYLIFTQALQDVEHQPHETIPVFMCGLLMLGITLGLSFATYDQINPIKDYRKFEKLSTRISIIIGLLFSVFSLCIGEVVSEENKEKKAVEPKNQLQILRRELKKAISEERFEDAAVLRDKIKLIEKKTS